jgi:hypothetical protein
MHDVYAAKPLFLARRRTVDSMAEPGGLEHLPDEIHATDTAPRPHCAANRFLTASRCSKQGAWHGCSDPTPKRQPPLPDARG